METVLTTVLTEAREDLVGVWLVLRWIHSAFPRLTAVAAREATLEVIAKALDSGQVVAGGFVDDASRSFEKWGLPPRASLERIEAAWKALGRDPDIGDNLWLVGSGLDYATFA